MGTHRSMPNGGTAADTPAPLVCPPWCNAGPHGSPPCHSRAIETIVLNDGIIRVSLSQQEPVDKGPKVQVVVHAHGDTYNSVYAARIDVYDAHVLGAALAATDALEGFGAYDRALVGTNGGAIAKAFAKAALEAGVKIPRERLGRGSGRGRPAPQPTLRERLAGLWKAGTR